MEILLQLAKEQGFIVATLFAAAFWLARQYKQNNEKAESKLAKYEEQNQARQEKLEKRISDLEEQLDKQKKTYELKLEEKDKEYIQKLEELVKQCTLALNQNAQTLRTFCELFKTNKNIIAND